MGAPRPSPGSEAGQLAVLEGLLLAEVAVFGAAGGYVDVEDETRWAAIAGTDVCRRGWTHMREVMPSRPDDSRVSVELREVCHLD